MGELIQLLAHLFRKKYPIRNAHCGLRCASDQWVQWKQQVKSALPRMRGSGWIWASLLDSCLTLRDYSIWASLPFCCKMELLMLNSYHQKTTTKIWTKHTYTYIHKKNKNQRYQRKTKIGLERWRFWSDEKYTEGELQILYFYFLEIFVGSSL